MSVPHTGKLTATIRGIECRFDGEQWKTSDAPLAEMLNEITASSPKQHYDIRSLAEYVLRRGNLLQESRITSWEADAWVEQPPDNAID